jgi:hypothetical protein
MAAAHPGPVRHAPAGTVTGPPTAEEDAWPAAAGTSGPQSPRCYEIRVEGILDERWTAWFDGLQISSEGGQTVICGRLPDQPALHGVLAKVRDLGLSLICVRRLDADRARNTPTVTRDSPD